MVRNADVVVVARLEGNGCRYVRMPRPTPIRTAMAIAAAVMSMCSIAWFRTSTQFSEKYSLRLSVLLHLVSHHVGRGKGPDESRVRAAGVSAATRWDQVRQQ